MYKIIDPELRREIRAYKINERKKAIKTLFNKNKVEQRWNGRLTVSGWSEEFIEKPIITKAFYWLKAVICILLNRTNAPYLTFGSFEVAYWDVRPAHGEYSGYDWVSLWIEPGVFKNWNVRISNDSSY